MLPDVGLVLVNYYFGLFSRLFVHCIWQSSAACRFSS